MLLSTPKVLLSCSHELPLKSVFVFNPTREESYFKFRVRKKPRILFKIILNDRKEQAFNLLIETFL